jgi:hypothetical protein
MSSHACDDLVHRALKSSYFAFALGTVRLIEHMGEECYQHIDGTYRLWLRDCRTCRSTLAMKVDVRAAYVDGEKARAA